MDASDFFWGGSWCKNGLIKKGRMEKETKSAFEVVDKRGGKFYVIDDLFDEKYAALVGPFGYAVYGSLCKHANKQRKAWPGVDTLAPKLGMSRMSVFGAIEILEFYSIICKDRVGKRCTNRYLLLPIHSWRKDWSVMSASLTSGEVRLKYFTSKHSVLHQYATRTSNSNHTQELDPSKVAANAATPNSKKCKGEGCGNNSLKGREYCEVHQPMNFGQFVAYCEKSPNRHIQIIGEWADTVEPDMQTFAQWNSYIVRNVRVAKLLVPFTKDQLKRGFERIEAGINAGWLTDYNLETLFKKVTELVANGKRQTVEPVQDYSYKQDRRTSSYAKDLSKNFKK